MSEAPGLVGFVGGALAVGYAVAAVFFLRFWRRVGERLFLAFALAFALLALAQGLQLLSLNARDWDSHVYLARLAAFVVIILAIVAKNLSRRG